MICRRDLHLSWIAGAALLASVAAAAVPASDGVSGFHARGRRAMEQGDLAAAAQAFDRALANRQESATLWVDIGRLRYRAGQHHLAVEAAAQALELDREEPKALEFQARLTRDGRGAAAALLWFERAIAESPDDLDLLGEYAATLAEAGRHKDMLRVARRMAELDSRHPRAYYLQAVLAARAGLDDLARRLLARTGGAYDDVPAGQLLGGVLLLRSGNAALAVERFDALARRQPDNGAAQLLMGRALLANGEANEVAARLALAADDPGASPYLLTLVGRAYEQMGKRREAARYLDRAAGAGLAAVGVLAGGGNEDVARIRQTLLEGRTEEAQALARQLRQRYPDSIDVEMLAGDVWLVTGDPEQALAAYESAAAVRRNFALVERMVAAERKLGREDAAIGRLSDYLAQNPRSAPASRLLAQMLRPSDERRAELLLAHARRLTGVSPREDGRVAATLKRLAQR